MLARKGGAGIGQQPGGPCDQDDQHRLTAAAEPSTQIEPKRGRQDPAQKGGRERGQADEHADPRGMPRLRDRLVGGNGRCSGEDARNEQLSPETGCGEIRAASHVECRRQRVEAQGREPERKRDANEQQVPKTPGGEELCAQQPGGAQGEEREHRLQRRAKRRCPHLGAVEDEREDQRRGRGNQHWKRAVDAAHRHRCWFGASGSTSNCSARRRPAPRTLSPYAPFSPLEGLSRIFRQRASYRLTDQRAQFFGGLVKACTKKRSVV